MLKKSLYILRQRYRTYRLESGEKGWGSPAAPLPVLKRVSADKSFRAAIVGAGRQGLAQGKAFNGISGVDLAGLADLSSEKLTAAAGVLNLPKDACFTDAELMLREIKNLDVVSIATLAPTHVRLGRLALQNRAKCIVLEKPMDTSLTEAKKFTEECREAGVKLAVNYSRRWMVDYQAIRRCLAQGYIGVPRVLNIIIGKGELAMHASHYFDLCRYILQSEPSAIRSEFNRVRSPNLRGKQFDDPSGVCFLTFENGARSYIDFSDDLEVKSPFVLIKGTHGQITVDEQNGFWTLQSRSQKKWTFPFVEPLKSETLFKRVICELLSGKTPAAGGGDGIMALELILAAHLSNQKGGNAVRLPLSDEEKLPEVLFP